MSDLNEQPHNDADHDDALRALMRQWAHTAKDQIHPPLPATVVRQRGNRRRLRRRASAAAVATAASLLLITGLLGQHSGIVSTQTGTHSPAQAPDTALSPLPSPGTSPGTFLSQEQREERKLVARQWFTPPQQLGLSGVSQLTSWQQTLSNDPNACLKNIPTELAHHDSVEQIQRAGQLGSVQGSITVRQSIQLLDNSASAVRAYQHQHDQARTCNRPVATASEYVVPGSLDNSLVMHYSSSCPTTEPCLPVTSTLGVMHVNDTVAVMEITSVGTSLTEEESLNLVNAFLQRVQITLSPT